MSEITEHTFTSYLGPEFQQRLMWQILVEPEFAEKTIPVLAVEYFDDPNLKRMFLIILEFYKEYGKTPNLQNQSIQQAIHEFKTPNNTMEEESLFSVLKRIELWNERVLNETLMYDGDIIQKGTNNFIKQQEYRKLAEGILSKVKSGEMKNKKVIVEIEEKFQKVAVIGDDEDAGSDATEGLEKALTKEFRKTIPTGVKVIDALTGGGLGMGEMGLILTPSGVGKTTLLTMIANTARNNDKNVLQIIFEDTKEQIQRKHVTIWTGIPLSELDDRNEEALEKSNKYIETLGPGRLTIKKFSQEDTTMRDVKDFIIREQKKHGFKFDIIVLDYLDCLESHKRTSDRNEAELVIVKAFEALAGDLNIPCWSAIQSNRSGFDAELVEAHQAGGNIKRVQKAHFFMSVAKTPDQKEASLASIRIIKARFAQDGQTFKDCKFNNDTMQIVIKDDRYVGDRIKGVKKYGDDEIKKHQEKVSGINHGLISVVASGTEKTPDEIELDKMREAYLKKNDTVIEKTETEGTTEGANEGTTIDNIHISTTRTDLTQDEIKGVVEFVKDTLLELDESGDTINDGVSDAVNDGVNDTVNIQTEELLDWSGQTETVGTYKTETTVEDLPPIETIPENEVLTVKKQENEEKNQSIFDIEMEFDDPDSIDNQENETLILLQEMGRTQKVIDTS